MKCELYFLAAAIALAGLAEITALALPELNPVGLGFMAGVVYGCLRLPRRFRTDRGPATLGTKTSGTAPPA